MKQILIRMRLLIKSYCIGIRKHENGISLLNIWNHFYTGMALLLSNQQKTRFTN